MGFLSAFRIVFLVSAVCSAGVKNKSTQDQVVHNATVTGENSRFLFSGDSVTGRACAACTGTNCNTNTTISSLPVIQILVALASGIVWAGIFIYLYKNFYEKEHASKLGSLTEGWGWSSAPVPAPMPQYGVPHQQHGMHMPQSHYGPPPPRYGAPQSRSLNPDFMHLTQKVMDAVKSLS